MKKILTTLILFCACWAGAQIPFSLIGTTTPGTVPSSSGGFLNLTNLTLLSGPGGTYYSLLTPYTTTNPAFPTLGDLLPTAFGKINTDFGLLLSSVLATNANANGEVPIATNIGGIYLYYWGFPPAGGSGGGATNLTPWTSDINAAGFSLTNAGNVKTTNLTAATSMHFNGQNGGNTNILLFSYSGPPFGGTYLFDALNNLWTNLVSDEAITNGGFGQSYVGAVIGSDYFLYYSNSATTFPGTNDSWLGLGPYGGDKQTLVYTGPSETVSNNGAIVLLASNNVGIGTNSHPFFALQISGDLNVSGNIYTNGGLFKSGGLNYTNNSTGLAGVINGSGIGTIIPPVLNATNAQFSIYDGLPLASYAATMGVVQGGYVTNWEGLETNATVIAVATNLTIVSLSTNGAGLVLANYQTVITYSAPVVNTNFVQIYDASDANFNGIYGFNAANGASYTNLATPLTTMFRNGNFGWYANVHSVAYNYTSTISAFPSLWFVNGQSKTALGTYLYTGTASAFSTNNTTGVFGFGYGTPLNFGGIQTALNAIGTINAQGYQLYGQPLNTLIQGMSFPYVMVTGGTNMSTNYSGLFGNTGLGYYTNLAYGTILAPAGSTINLLGTNFTTSISLLCSNPATLGQNQSYYINPTNGVLGAYSVVEGHDNAPTNQLVVAPLWQLPGVTTNLQFVDGQTVLGVFTPMNTNTLYWTNGLLMRVTSP